jgi:hypothetical protein
MARSSTLPTAKHSTTPGRRRGCRHAFQPAMVVETQQQTPRRRAGAPARPIRSGSSSKGASSTGAANGGNGDERRRDRQIATVRWESVRRRSKCPTWRRQRLPEIAGKERWGRRRLTVARGAREIRVRVESSEREGGAADWARLVQSNPLGLTCPVGPGCQPIFIYLK